MKKLAKYVSAVLVCLFSSILLVACGEPEITKAYIKDGSIVTTVDAGSEKSALKLNQAVAVIEFSDGTKVEVDASKLTFGNIDLSTIGNDKVLKVTYAGFEFEVEIDVVKPHVVDARIKAGTIASYVIVGTPINLANAVAQVKYSNSDEYIDVPAAELGFGVIDTTTIGEDKPLRITYDGYSFEITIDVVADPDDAILKATSASYIVKGSITDTVIEGAEISELGLDNAKLVIVYDNGTATDPISLTSANFNTTGLDLTTVGTKVINAIYTYNADKNLSITIPVQITVTEDVNLQKVAITEFSSNLVTEFEANKGVKTNKETEFVEKDKIQMVGDDNPLDFRINAKGIVNDLPAVVDIYNTKITVKLDGESAELSTQDFAKYIEGTTRNTIDFSSEAVGKTFNITVTATYIDPSYIDVEQDEDKFTMKVKVVDGYNVYSAKELSLFDNANIGGSWTELKTKWGLIGVETNALVLQNSIFVNDEVIPASHFYTKEEVDGMDSALKNSTNQEIVGSFKESADAEDMVYYRYLLDDENFNIYGNYFDISIADKQEEQQLVKGLSRSVINADKKGITTGDTKSYITMHSALFEVNGARIQNGTKVSINQYYTNDVNNPGYQIREYRASTGKISIQDTYFIGNAGRSDDSLPSGGLILLKSDRVKLDVTNTIQKDWFIGWFTDYGYDQTGLGGINKTTNIADWNNMILNGNEDRNTETHIYKSKGYNNYSSLFYFWGTPNIIIEDSEFVGCGGPAIIADQAVGDGNEINNFNPETGFGGFAPEIDIINSKVESWVTGLEPWYQTYGATALATKLASVNSAYTVAQSTFLIDPDKTDQDNSENKMNSIVLIKHGGKEVASGSTKTRGYARIFATKQDYDNYYDTNPDNNGSYLGYDRTMIYDKDTNELKYTGTAINTLIQATPTTQALGCFENSSNGAVLEFGTVNKEQIVPHGAYYQMAPSGKTYLNGYLNNGFGLIFELFAKSAD